MSKIFEEALADAKKLREVAEENAKKVILESVTPKIREFIEEQLLESDDESKDEIKSGATADQAVDEDEEQIDEATIKNLLSMIGGKELFESISSNEEKNIIKKAIYNATNKLDLDQKNKIHEISNKINQNIDKLRSSEINNNVDTIQENNLMSNREKYYEIDLKMLREAVEEEAEALEMADMYEKDDDEDLKELDMSEEDLMNELKILLDLGDLPGIEADELNLSHEVMDDDEEGDEVELEDPDELDQDLEDPEDAPEEELEGEPAEEIMNEVFDVDPNMLRRELANIRKQLQEGNVDHHFGGKSSGKSNHSNSFGGPGPKKHGHQKSFGGGSEGKDAFVNPPQINKLNEAIRQLSRKNRAQTEKLNKYRGAVQTLREQLEDLNLFNAKLLYVNKLLQNKSLTESQKKSVIKALDEAKNVGETKALYKSLTESLGSTKKNLNESTRFGSSSRVTTSASSKNAVGELDRWQKLAGLK